MPGLLVEERQQQPAESGLRFWQLGRQDGMRGSWRAMKRCRAGQVVGGL
ncbi:hypothetical protein [Streptomyces sp. NPDC101206]